MNNEQDLDVALDQVVQHHRQGMECLANLCERYDNFMEVSQETMDEPLSPYMARQVNGEFASAESSMGLESSALTFSVRRGGQFTARSQNVAMRLLKATTDSLGVLFDKSGRKRLELAWRELNELQTETVTKANLDNPRLRQRLSVDSVVVRDAGTQADNDFSILTTLLTTHVANAARTINAVDVAMSPIRTVREERFSERMATFLKAVAEIKTVYDSAGNATMQHCYLGGMKLLRYVPPSEWKVKGTFFSTLVTRILNQLDKSRRTEAAYNTTPTSEDVVLVKVGEVKVLSRAECERYLNTAEDLIGFGDLVKKTMKSMKGTGARDLRVTMIAIMDSYNENGIHIEPDTKRELDVALMYLNHDLVQHLELLPGIMAIALRTIDTLTSYVRASVEAHKQG